MRKSIGDVLDGVCEADYATVETGDAEALHLIGHNLKGYLADLEKRMLEHAANLEFEEAARLRDEINRLEGVDLGLGPPASRTQRQRRGRHEARSTAGRPGTRQVRGKVKKPLRM